MNSVDYQVNRRDILFNLHEVLDLDRILALDAFKEFDKDTLNAMIEEAAKFTEKEIWPAP